MSVSDYTYKGVFRIVTPLFAGGPKPEEQVRLSEKGIKGALQFWWRALAWHRYQGDTAKLREAEARLFGQAADKVAGQSRVRLRLVPPEPAAIWKRTDNLIDATGAPDLPGALYFGYGLAKSFGKDKGQLERPCLVPGQRFTLEVGFRGRRGSTSAGDEEEAWRGVRDALILFGLVGGLGSRSRRGYGAVSLESLGSRDGKASWTAPVTAEDYAEELRKRLAPAGAAGRPPYSAISGETRVDILARHRNPLYLHDFLGRQMQRYRAWGYRDASGERQVNGRPSEKNFEDDHDWFKDQQQRGGPTGGQPCRAVFGLPQGYAKDFVFQAKPGSDPDRVMGDRRGSPLFLHIHQPDPQKEALAVALVLRSSFLPEGAQVEIARGGGRGDRVTTPPKAEYQVIDRFLDGFDGKVYFPDARKVFPHGR